MIIDVHCHYTLTRCPTRAVPRFTFEPAAGGGDDERYPTGFDSCVSPRALHRLTWRLARRLSGLPRPGPGLDEVLAARYAEHLCGAGPVERFVLLALDAVHDDEGRVCPLPMRRGELGSDIYTSNSFVRELCRQRPDRYLFGASVHPYRRDAEACVEEVFAAGACLLKWLPVHQNIRADDRRTLAVLRKCAGLGLPVLLHCGHEFSLASQCLAGRPAEPWLAALRRLRKEAQEQGGRMPTVIFAHAATANVPLSREPSHAALLAALRGEFADAPVYADLSALLTWVKVPRLRALARAQDLHAKLLFGSDFPIPTGVWAVRRELGAEYHRIARMPSWPQRAAVALRRMGFNEIVFHRAAEVLANMRGARVSAPAPPGSP